MLKKELRTWAIGIEEIVLISIIILNFFDAVEYLSPTLDYVKKIISWAALGYLFYHSKPTKIIFGTKNSKMDFLLVISYFLILIKDLVSYARSSINETSKFLMPLFKSLIENQSSIESFGIYAGLFLIFTISVNMVMKYDIKEPSVLSIFRKNKLIPKNFKSFFFHSIEGFVLLLAFYLIVFNLVMEWLAIAIDAPLLMISLAIYIFISFKHKHLLSSKKFLNKFGNFGSSFYEEIIKKFMYKKTILRSLYALLVLHIATESLHFIWPYIFSVADSLYFGVLNSVHLSAFQIFIIDSAGFNLLNMLLLVVAILGNVLAVLFLLLAPGYLWFLIYKNKKFSLSRMNIVVLVSSLLIFILMPAFRFTTIIDQPLLGVDISAQSIVQNSLFGLPLGLLIALTGGLVVSLLSVNINYEKRIMRLITLISQLFFIGYIFLFTVSLGDYYLKTIKYLFINNYFYMGFIFSLFFIILLLFYFGGTFSFLRDTIKHANEHLKTKV